MEYSQLIGALTEEDVNIPWKTDQTCLLSTQGCLSAYEGSASKRKHKCNTEEFEMHLEMLSQNLLLLLTTTVFKP